MNQHVVNLESQPAKSIQGRHIFERVQRAMSAATLEQIDPQLIRPYKNQPRKTFDQVRLRRLADSIAEGGQIMPGIVRRISRDLQGCVYELCDGERRWQSVMLAGVEEYRALVVDIDEEAAQYVVSIVANFNREGHPTIELVDSIVRMHEELELTIKEIAGMVGLSAVYTQNLYGLRRLAPEVRDMLDPNLTKRPLSTTAAIEIAGLPQDKQVDLASRIMSGQVNSRNVRREVVAVSKASNLPTREYKMHPSDRRRSIQNRVENLATAASELKAMLNGADAPAALKDWSLGEVQAILRSLEQSAKDLLKSHEKLSKLVKAASR